jgi:uncharacterized protein (DUF433 family)
MSLGRLGGGSQRAVPPDPHYWVPLYQKAEAARIIRVPRGTLRDWAGPVSDDASPGSGGRVAVTPPGHGVPGSSGLTLVLSARPEPLITTARPSSPQGPTIPFIGLAEAYVLASFRNAGVPMQRIRPALQRLEHEMGLEQALASERLKTDGAEVLWDYGQDTDDQAEKDAVGELVVVRNGQLVFKAVVAKYLRRVAYEDGWARVINVGAGKVDVTVDPWVNGGRPTLPRRGIAVDDVMSRVRGGETLREVAADYGLRISEVTALRELAA